MQSTKWELYEYQMSKPYIDLGPYHSDSIFLNFFSSITADLIYPQHSGERYRTNGPLVEFKRHWTNVRLTWTVRVSNGSVWRNIMTCINVRIFMSHDLTTTTFTCRNNNNNNNNEQLIKKKNSTWWIEKFNICLRPSVLRSWQLDHLVFKPMLDSHWQLI